MTLNKVFVNIDARAVEHNVAAIRRLLAGKTRLWAVVKSNAYGHGLVAFSKLADKYGVDGFCVDSVVEGEKLRKEGIKKPILVLGPTFKPLLESAAKNKITITVSSFDGLAELSQSRFRPEFHLKIDTGMHRQGFYPEELPRAITIIKNSKFLPAGRHGKIENCLKGAYTHFASAKDINYPAFTEGQFRIFQKAVSLLDKAGYKQITKHAAATGGTLVNPKYHLDAVRVGIGLYGLWPSPELMTQFPKIKLRPVLSWQAIVSEVKNLKPGDFVGYDLVERVSKKTKMAIVPVGYWHGIPRALSGIGEVLISGKRCRILGRVSMDLISVDATGVKCVRGSRVTLIGRQRGEEINAYEIARKLGASYYELLTRINPLTERRVV